MKKDIIAHMRANTDLSAEAADIALSAVAAAVTAVANRDGAARVPGLGTFKIRAREERMGRNPATGEAIKIKARKILTFKEASRG